MRQRWKKQISGQETDSPITPLLMIPKLDVAVNDDNELEQCLYSVSVSSLLRRLPLSHLRMQALPQCSSQVQLL